MNEILNKSEIIEILKDWNPWEKNLEGGIPRESYINRLKEYTATNQIVVITGPRRSGKSYIMRQFANSLIEKDKIGRERILFINFEDPRLPPLEAKQLDEIFKIYLKHVAPGMIPYVFLDEIQEVSGWEKWVRTMHELGKAKLLISGSNSRLLGKELATVLTGRHLDLMVFPLSFDEYLIFKGLKMSEAEKSKAVRKYLEEGGYPEAVLSNKTKEILLGYFDDILNRDIIRRYKIRKAEKLKAMAKFYFSQMASLITYNSTAKFLGLTTATAEKFSGHLESSYLFFTLKRFSFKVKEQEKSPRKLYTIDTGLANAVGFRFSENLGRAAENLVFLKLRRKQAENPNLEIYFWKDVHHREVDFVLKEEMGIRELIQVSWSLNRLETKDREMRALLKAMRELDVPRALIINEEQDFEEKVGDRRITFIPLWKWLLN